MKPLNITLDYDFKFVINADYDSNESSCINYLVVEQKDTYDKYGGLPTSYCYQNTLIRQLWWDNTQLDFQEIGRQLGMEVITISTIRQDPGCVIPAHRDEFYQIKLRHPDRTESKVRANIYLQDWKLGHFLQYGDNISTHWTAGQGHMWDRETLHLSANAGLEPKFTMQISGFIL